MSRWKNGHTIPQANNCSCIAETFGVDPEYVLRLAGHMPAVEPLDPDADAWVEQQRRWSIRFDQGVRSLPRPVDDNCTERTVTAWLDAFALLVNRLG